MYFLAACYLMANMKTIEEIHRENLTILLAEAGSTSQLAEMIGRSASQVSQWANGSANSATGKPRAPGASSCRLLESACGKPKGWMDIEHPAGGDAARQDAGPAQYQWVSQVEAELLSNFRTVSDDGRTSILTLSRTLDKIAQGAHGRNQG